VVRIITDVLDDDAANDTVTTIFGKVRDDYPAAEAFCLSGIAIANDGAVAVADACQGFLVTLRPEALP